MNDLVHADIFFFVSTILLGAATLVFIIAMVYILRILRDIRAIASLARKEVEKISNDLENLREKVKSGRAIGSVASMWGVLSGIWKKRKRKGRS